MMMNTPLKQISKLIKSSSPLFQRQELIKQSPILLQCQNTITPNVQRESVKQKVNINKCKSNLFGFNQVEVQVTDFSRYLNLSSNSVSEVLKNGLLNKKDVDVIGRGSFGTVILGYNHGTTVAVKIINLNKSKQQFTNESNAVVLKHPNVIKVLNIVHDMHSNYGLVLMEYYSNSKNLQTILDERKFDIDTKVILKYSTDICEGLKYCHENNVLHLDVKPKNVLVTKNSVCKLCDFGNSQKLLALDENTRITCGTVAYTAPELFLGNLPDANCDIYSLGILLWQLETKEIPYNEIRGSDLLIYKVVKFNYRPKIKPTNNDEFTKIYQKCWTADPKERPNIDTIIKTFRSIISTSNT